MTWIARHAPGFCRQTLRHLITPVLWLLASSPLLAQAYEDYLVHYDPFFVRISASIPADPVAALATLDQMNPGDLSSDVAQAQYRLLLCDVYNYLERLNEMLAAAEQGLEQVSVEQQPWLYHSFKLCRADALVYLGRSELAMPDIYAALHFGEQIGHVQLQVGSLMSLAYVYNELGLYDRTLQHLTQAHNLAPLDGIGLTRNDVVHLIGTTYSYMGNEERALELYKSALDTYRKRNQPIDTAVALYNMALSHQYLGNDGQVWPLIEESAEISRAAGDELGEAYALLLMADQHFWEGNERLAVPLLDQVEQVAREGNHSRLLFETSLSAVDAYMALGNLENARAYMEQAEALIETLESPFARVDLQFYWSELLAAEGDYEQAYEQLALSDQLEFDLSDREMQNRFSQLASVFELEQQRTENALLQETNELQLSVIESQRREKEMLIALAVVSLSFSVAVVVIATRLWRQGRRLNQLANFDSLTGLRNRDSALEKIQEKLADSRANGCVLAILDLDYFKRINDEFGHLTGDQVLEHFGELCGRQFRGDEIVARLGGEEFLVFVSGSSAASLVQRLDRLRNLAIGLSTRVNEIPVRINFSAGVCECRQTGPNLSELMKLADTALYEAKHTGRGRTLVADDLRDA